ncbi:ATP-binding cassette, subfamily B [Bacteroides luti]|uniref:ATP-binding cassette, subfamily B n=2 Tax=Bacteroides luti TaxID=1297750 RepID=A0A1M4VGI0_9BACE|nr:ATP-binding cassette, subfamily B [Bacteroides luti]
MNGMMLAFALLSNVINLILPKIISKTIDGLSKGEIDFKLIAILFLGASFLISVFTLLQNVVQTYTAEKVAKDTRNKLSDKILRQSFAYIQQANPSKLLTNLTSDIDSVKQFVSQAVVSIISSIFVIIGVIILLFSINWQLTTAILIIIPAISGAFYFTMRKAKPKFKKSREAIDNLNLVINESILGSMLIRIMNAQQKEYNKFINSNIEARNIGLSIVALFSTLIPIISFIADASILITVLLGGHFVISDSMTLGDFAAFNSYLSILFFPIMVIGFMSNIISQASVSYKRVKDVLEAPETVEEGKITGEITGNIEVDNVSVIYNGKPALKDISFSVKAGSRIAVIGPTAAGKSQLLYALTGLITPNFGTIKFDDNEVNQYNAETFHSQVGFVFQDSIIFNVSIRENIAFSNQVTEESFEKAIDTAELRDFVNNLPNKLDTMASERGTSLSGGQKQRIMLARALALNPKVLLLDDFTARVDNKTEKKILKNIEENYPGITLISISQKVSSIKNFDQIVLIMEGEMIAKGTHQELINNCTEYIQIYNSQKSTHFYEL